MFGAPRRPNIDHKHVLQTRKHKSLERLESVTASKTHLLDPADEVYEVQLLVSLELAAHGPHPSSPEGETRDSTNVHHVRNQQHHKHLQAQR